MMSCKEAARLVSASQRRVLSWRERTALRMHLALCSACRNFRKQMELMTEAARRFGRRGEAFRNLRLSEEARRRIAIRLAAWRAGQKD